MRFLFIQIIIVVLVCLFIAALSNLTEMGVVGWLIAASTGHALYKIYKHIHYSFRTSNSKRKCPTCNSRVQDFSGQLQSIMFDDATELSDE